MSYLIGSRRKPTNIKWQLEGLFVWNFQSTYFEGFTRHRVLIGLKETLDVSQVGIYGMKLGAKLPEKTLIQFTDWRIQSHIWSKLNRRSEFVEWWKIRAEPAEDLIWIKNLIGSQSTSNSRTATIWFEWSEYKPIMMLSITSSVDLVCGYKKF